MLLRRHFEISVEALKCYFSGTLSSLTYINFFKLFKTCCGSYLATQLLEVIFFNSENVIRHAHSGSATRTWFSTVLLEVCGVL